MRNVLRTFFFFALVLIFSQPCAAMELVVFKSGRSLVVESYGEKGVLALMVLPGGGEIGVPKRLVSAHYPGYVPARGDDSASTLPESLPYRKLIAKYCRKYQMDWKIVAAVIKVESNFNPEAVSPRGAQGLMQLMPSTQKEMGVNKPFDPEENIKGGVHYLRKLLDTFQGDLELTLAAYNAGISRVKAGNSVPPFPETRAYVTKIISLYPTL